MDGLVGRGDELAALEGFLDRGPTPGARALILEGPPGIGKTSLWSDGIARARRRGFRVLTAQPAAADTALSYVGLADLLREVPPDQLAPLPDAQRVALTETMEGTGAVHEARVIHPALLSALGALIAENGLVVAIDDLQWLDPESAGALSFALRRLQGRDLRVLLARRLDSELHPPHPVEVAVDSERLTVGPLDLEHTIDLLRERVGITLPRTWARRLYEITDGNPLFVIELGRSLQAGSLPGALENIRLPHRVESLLAERVGSLSQPARSALLAVALAGDSPLAELAATVGLEALDEALDAGVLVAEHERVRVVHPLLAEVARQRGGSGTIRALHRAIADVTADQERRALHLAQATHGPDEEIAAIAAAASAEAAARGSRRIAAVLAEHALRLTPVEASLYPERLLAAADSLWRASDMPRAVELLASRLDGLTSPEHRAVACLLLTECDESLSDSEVVVRIEQAIQEMGEEAAPLRGRLLAALSTHLSVATVTSLGLAEGHASEAYAAVRGSGDEAIQEESLAALCWARAMRGGDLRPLLSHRDATPRSRKVLLHNGVDRVEAVWLMWRGELDQARRRLVALSEQAEERGEEESYLAFRLHLCELELRSGRWDSAQTMIDVWERTMPVVAHADVYLKRCRSLLALGRGAATDALLLADEALTPIARGGGWNELEAERALGLAHLLLGEPERAAGSLGNVWQRTRAAGVGDLGVFPVGHDLAEALALCDRAPEAAAVAQALSDAATNQVHPWSRAAQEHAWGHALLAQGEAAAAATRFERAAAGWAELGLALDHGRSLVALGLAHRRARRVREARAALERATLTLERLGSPGWAERARTELERVGGRRRATTLTATEQQVGALVQQGLANKQIAQRLVISTSTVEAHLTRIYRKLGVASRTELAHLLASQSVGKSPIPDRDRPP